jgi:hypothetical protein
MKDDLLREALKEVRSGAAAVVVLSLLWLVTAHTVGESLIKREHGRQLAAWTFLKETFPDTFAEVLKDADRTKPLDCFPETVPIQGGTEETCGPLWVSIPWLGDQDGKVSLIPIPGTSAYGVAVPSAAIPLSSYALTPIDGRLWVVPRQYARSERDLHNAILGEQHAAPVGWASIKMSLRAAGWEGDRPTQLHLSDKTVASFITQSFTASYSVAGIPLAPGYYLAAISVALTLFAFLLLGPTLIIQTSEEGILDSWVMLATKGGWSGRVLSALQMLITIGVLLLPLAVLVSQLQFLRLLSTTELVIWAVTAPGAVFTTIVLSALGRRLSHLRRKTAALPLSGPAEPQR